ncbi:MAG: T9SS type A sorting domain-containing protein [Lewinellaceae bacterium]|nr:T9SS type A sorting domain-containing protein [Lewinellaceae bacterium]
MKFRVLLQAIALLLLFGPMAKSQTNVNCIDATISVVGGATQITTCEGDGLATTYRFKVKPFAMPFGYLVTDENNIILKFSLSNVISFEGLGGGNLRVWAFSFLGTTTVQLGQDATTAQLATLCWNLTNNYIPVINFVPDAGAVSTSNGNTSIFVCSGDGSPDVVEFTNTSSAGQDYAYLITDENDVITAIASGNSYDFESSPEGVYHVWGLAFAGNLEAMVGDTVGVSQLAGDCYGISENFIEVTSSQPDGGTVELSNGETSATICVEDGVSDVLTFTNQTGATAPYVFLVTDDNNFIIAVVDGNSYDFESPGSGEQRIWGLSYSGVLLGTPGQNAATDALSTDCFDLSDNYITVIRQVAEGGSVALDNGDTDGLACVGDGEPDLFTFTNNSPGADNYTYLVTDENNIIMAFAPDGTFDFDGAGVGVCRVWGLAYAGNLLAMVGDDAAAAILADGCFGLSDNFITIRREMAIGGTVAYADGSDLKYTCPGDGNADLLLFDSSGVVGSFTYVITDQQNIILDIPSGDSFDFDGAPAGTCLIWGLAYTGNLTAMSGDDAATATLSDGCFSLSENFLTVVRETPNGGSVNTEDGQTIVYTCPGDGNPDLITFDSSGTSSGPYAYVITDENNVILGFPGGDSFDFDGAPAGTCRIWGLAYTGTVTAMVGDTASAVPLSDDCFSLSDNFITVVREVPVGGDVLTETGDSTVYTCPGDGNADLLQFDSIQASNSPYVYVITDSDNIIVAFANGDSFDFEGLPGGVYRVWGLAYTGNLTAQIGDDAAAAPLSDDCFSLSSSFINVIHENVVGGVVSYSDGSDLKYTCPGDGNPDLLSFDSTGAAGGSFTYVITDQQNIILDVPAGDSFDFDGAPAGICYIWGLSYTGNLIAMVGDTASTAVLADGCFNLSSNYIAVIREVPEAGQVETENGETIVHTCPGDGNPDIIHFDSLFAGITPYAYVITDEANVILAFPGTDSFDFDGAPAGTCRVWGLAYTGNVTAMVGDTASAVPLSDDCFDLSSNYITVVRELPNGGTVATEDGETTVYTCPGDGNPDVIRFDSSGTSSGAYAYVITDANNVILGFPGGDSFDFDGAPAGTCRVWGLAYTGNVTAMVGDTASAIALSDDCFSLSENYITVNRQTPVGGTVATEDGETEVAVCPGDGNPDIIRFDSSGTAGLYVYVVTDENNIISTILDSDEADFDISGVGVSRIWGLAYTGNIIAQAGDDAASVMLTDDCFNLSDNYVTVIRQVPIGGTVATEDGENLVYACPGDGMPNIVTADSTGALGLYTYVITDENNIILSLPTGDSFDFDGAPAGTCRIWGLAYSGNITVMVGDDAAAVALSDDCFDLSDNYITVVRVVPDGGMVSRPNGATEVYVCPGDGNPDIVRADSSGTAGLYTYVITDENNIILSLPTGDSFDFDDAPAGICRIWGLAYTGNVTAAVGDDAAAVALSDDCFDLSDNYITVIRETPNAGLISSGAGPVNIEICVGDNTPDVVEFVVDGASNSNYLYIVTDQDDFIISAFDTTAFDFNNALSGVYRVYGLAFTGSPIVIPGDNIFDVDLSTDCFDLTDNFLEITAIGVDGATIFTSAGVGVNVLNLCVGDGQPNVIQFFTTTSATDADYIFAVTNEDNVVIGFIPGDEFDFELAGPGIAKVWGISYTGTLTLNIGDIITNVIPSSGCYDFAAEVITIIRDLPEGGSVSSDGETDVQVCPGPDSGLVPLETTSTSINAYVYLLTDTNNVVLDIFDTDEIDFNLLAEGYYRIWGLSYTGALNNIIGEDAAAVELATSCYELSANFISVYRGPAVEGGFVGTLFGQDTIYSCPDGISDLVIMTTSSGDANYRYVITNESNRVIVADVESNFIDFEGAAPGIYRVWGVSLNGDLLLGFNDDILTEQVASDCYQLSGNFITVIVEAPDGGLVLTDQGEDVVNIIVGDSIPDEITFVSAFASPNTPFTFVITDENNVILELLSGDTKDFEGADPGICRVWGLAYTGTVTAMAGDTASTAMLTDDCWDLSDNFVTINRVNSPELAEQNVTSEGVIQAMKLTPNPATEQVVVSFLLSDQAAPVSTLRMLDSRGQVMETRQVSSVPGENRYEFQIANWQGGLYVVYLNNGGEVKAKKLIVVRP